MASTEDNSIESNRKLNPGFRIFAGAIAMTLIFFIASHQYSNWLVELGFILSACVAISILIAEACEPFADAAQWVGIRLRLPPSVRGATLDAVASSMPELFTGLFFVTIALFGTQDDRSQMLASAEGYGSTVATCAGSSIYNLILIPALCAIVVSFSRRERPQITVSREVIHRDGMWVIFTQAGLLVFLFQEKLEWWMGVAALLTYIVYVLHLYLATRQFRNQLSEDKTEMEATDCKTASACFGYFDIRLNGFTSTLVIISATAVAALACYLLVDLTNQSAHKLGVSPFFVAVILTAAVSSIPDTFMSLGSARRGDDAGAMSNVFGSNVFDVCIGMSIPLIVSCYLHQWEPIELVMSNGETMDGVVGLRIFLFILTSVAMACMWQLKQINRRTGILFCALYASFVIYAILGALELIPA